jgi:hypothetical protein
MALSNTNLLIVMGPIPPTFEGTPQQFAEEMIRRMKIISPSGTNFIFVGDTEPTSNVGPWLKDGTSWYVFDEDTKRYVPLDISPSEKSWYQIGKSVPEVPGTEDPPLWLKTSHDPTEADPSFGQPIGWYEWNGTSWVPFVGIVLSGPSANRPASPEAYQQYYDTDIGTLIWFERGSWRTISGVPGDVKAVAFETLTEALTANPGWDVFGASNQAIRGRWISQATKDSGATPETNLSVGAGVAPRAAFETFGETDGVQIDSSSDVPYPPTISLWHLIKL